MTSEGTGPETAVSRSSATIRPARLSDARDIFLLIAQNPNELVPRPLASVVQNIDRFWVAEESGAGLVAAATYQVYPEIGAPHRATVELQSVCVRQDRRGLGIGRRIVDAVVGRVRAFDPGQIVVLTFTPPFFAKLGFHRVEKSALLYKLYMGCVNCTKHESPFTCPEVAMALGAPAQD